MISHDFGNGITVGPLEPWHAEAFAAAVEKDRAHLQPFIPFGYSVQTVEDAKAYLQRFADGHAADTRHVAGLWEGSTLVGLVMLPFFDVPSGICAIGIWVAATYEGKGLASGASRLAIDYAFRERGMQRVRWECDPANPRSSILAERLGFTLEGTLRKNYAISGLPATDQQVWGMMADEWGTAPVP